MAEHRSDVGISNREPSDEEARERVRHPRQEEGETVEHEQDAPEIREFQTSTKSGTKAGAQKSASARHTDRPAPSTSKVQGAFGKEPD
jgi:hypothetical protein